MTLFWKILNHAFAFSCTEGERIAFMIGVIAGADIGLVFAALCAAGKDENNGN